MDEVIYASTRMLHAWNIPAWVADRPYIDGYYTCACPAIEWQGVPIHIIRPEIDPATTGADFTDVTGAGLVAGYQHGLEIGRKFVESWKK